MTNHTPSHVMSHNWSCQIKSLLKYRKVTRLEIEPRTFWTYTKCSNQLSYLALEFNQLILYLCNCQPKDTYSARHIQCHSLQARSTLWPWHDQISQSGNHVTDYIIQFQQSRWHPQSNSIMHQVIWWVMIESWPQVTIPTINPSYDHLWPPLHIDCMYYRSIQRLLFPFTLSLSLWMPILPHTSDRYIFTSDRWVVIHYLAYVHIDALTTSI